ncbi:pollen-specific leucine-rich repeat extensin-like protein 2 [Populus alba x Populus x berolinensis]|nr:pollen-specific leucine-rich repeat extensin-like protein 2 [Populus alba x Populus x berolinensis]
MQALHREQEIQTLKGMLAQKDKETVRLKDQLLLRDKTISKLRALVEFAWTEFDSAKRRNINPKASAIEKHEKETIQEIKGTASIVNEIGITNQDGNTSTSAHVSSIKGEPPSLLSTFNGPQPPPAEAKIPREAPNPLTKEAKQDDKPLASAPLFYVGPILSVSNSKGHSLPPPPPPRMEANIVGATPTPVREFHIAPCPRPRRHLHLHLWKQTSSEQLGPLFVYLGSLQSYG